jgi:hypothetical protein
MNETIEDVSEETLLTTTQVAEILTIHDARMLAQWRKQGIHLPYIKLGNRVWYRESDVRSFEMPDGYDVKRARVFTPE